MSRRSAPDPLGILANATALARERGWPVVLATSRQCAVALDATTRLVLRRRGLVTVATVAFPLHPDVHIETPEDLARALGAGLADAALAVARPRIN